MSIEDRNLKPGTTLVARYKQKEHRAEVVEGEGGKVRYRLSDGREFTSPSAAGSAVMGGVACNGWRFWSLESEQTAKEGTEEAKTAKAEKPKAGRKGGSKGKPKASGNGTDGDGKGKGPVACGDCGQEFETSREAADHMRDEHNSQEAHAGEKS